MSSTWCELAEPGGRGRFSWLMMSERALSVDVGLQWLDSQRPIIGDCRNTVDLILALGSNEVPTRSLAHTDWIL